MRPNEVSLYVYRRTIACGGRVKTDLAQSGRRFRRNWRELKENESAKYQGLAASKMEDHATARLFRFAAQGY